MSSRDGGLSAGCRSDRAALRRRPALRRRAGIPGKSRLPSVGEHSGRGPSPSIIDGALRASESSGRSPA